MTVLIAVMVMCGLAALVVFASHLAANSTVGEHTEMVERVNALLPQTQCGRCSFAGCRPYATALVQGNANTDQCPPGGNGTAAALALLLRREERQVDPKYGVMPSAPTVAWIDEPACIGCTKCIQACPVDAIVGASRFMHTVISAQCTGCELCIPPCPVDCIEMRPATIGTGKRHPAATGEAMFWTNQ